MGPLGRADPYWDTCSVYGSTEESNTRVATAASKGIKFPDKIN